MTIKRLAALAAFVFSLLPRLALADAEWVRGTGPQEPPLAGTNSISNVRVNRQPDGAWKVTFDYFWTGAPIDTGIYIEQVVGTGAVNEKPVQQREIGLMPQRGQHTQTMDLRRPKDERMRLTREVHVQFRHGAKLDLMTEASIKPGIEWADYLTMQVEADLAKQGVDGVIKEAAERIDTEEPSELAEARGILEKVIDRHPDADAAYLELARVAMKSNWGPEALHQAEALIGSALQIRPDSANAKILLAYVYANQKRYAQAEALFADAARANPPNLWLWVNWGELLQMQDREDAALQKFRQAVERPPTGDTYDRARLQAYWYLLRALEQRKDVNGMEALFRKRSEEYSGARCSGVLYGRFLVLWRAEAKKAIGLVRDTPASRCDPAATREVLGLAYYVGWGTGGGPESVAMLNQARVYLPAGPTLFYRLASSDVTVPTLQRLLAAGEKIDQQDGRRMNALGYALGEHDLDAAARLLRAGARADAPVGEEQMPVALLPAATGDVEAVAFLRKSGVDYSKIRFQGVAAPELARRTGNADLLKAMDPKAGAL